MTDKPNSKDGRKKGKALPKATMDEILDAPEAARWLKITPRMLLSESQGERAKIPGFWLNDRVVRFHRQIILAKLAHDAGLPPELIAAALSKSHFPTATPPLRPHEPDPEESNESN
ncbi:MAG TPA: hypothetical protein VGY56_17380 [Verrucomicrobiae bacterium]|nr:hypothetical protein [Verrucomicrobiae bacterium]